MASVRAYTLASWSWRYTTPLDTTGAAVSEPEYDTPAAAVPASLNAQASRSVDTFADEITEPGASLVLARLPFGYGHCPEGGAAPGKSVVTGVELLSPPVAGGSVVTETRRAAGRNKRTPRCTRHRRSGLGMVDLLSSKHSHQSAGGFRANR